MLDQSCVPQTLVSVPPRHCGSGLAALILQVFFYFLYSVISKLSTNVLIFSPEFPCAGSKTGASKAQAATWPRGKWRRAFSTTLSCDRKVDAAATWGPSTQGHPGTLAVRHLLHRGDLD